MENLEKRVSPNKCYYPSPGQWWLFDIRPLACTFVNISQRSITNDGEQKIKANEKKKKRKVRESLHNYLPFPPSSLCLIVCVKKLIECRKEVWLERPICHFMCRLRMRPQPHLMNLLALMGNGSWEILTSAQWPS